MTGGVDLSGKFTTSDARQGLREIREQVLDVLDADRKPD